MRHAAYLLDVPVDSADVEITAPLFSDDEPLRIAGKLLDSLDLVEVFVCIEDDLQIHLLDAGAVEEIETLGNLSSYLLRTVDRTALGAYHARWGTGHRSTDGVE